MDDIWWWHSIELGGTVTPGQKPLTLLEEEWADLAVDVAGKSVLDIGCWDGWFSFRAEAEGAARVVALDHFVWSIDLPRWAAWGAECRERGVAPAPYEETEYWQPDRLPGMAGFEHARRALDSKVEPYVADFMTCDTDAVGVFDVVLCLGYLYHVEEPLTALRRLRRVTGGEAVVETEAVVDERSMCEFHHGAELNSDPTNWWVPSESALHGMLRAAGFSDLRTLAVRPGADERHCRLFVHAR